MRSLQTPKTPVPPCAETETAAIVSVMNMIESFRHLRKVTTILVGGLLFTINNVK